MKPGENNTCLYGPKLLVGTDALVDIKTIGDRPIDLYCGLMDEIKINTGHLLIFNSRIWRQVEKRRCVQKQWGGSYF